MPIAQPYGRALATAKARKPAKSTRKPAGVGGKPALTGRALALTRGQGKKIGLKRITSTTPAQPMTGTKRMPDTSTLNPGPAYTPPPPSGATQPITMVGGMRSRSDAEFMSGIGTRLPSPSKINRR